ncbi:Protein DDI1-like protein 1 [Camelus dromedarius]|uniref:Protein DDI1-like protein 1 n=1 Tax=Camelus dromedarius TaxID=9838 RepID=A0A5N4DNL5_CAMDR|nr:protein DDI1 homolog 1 [Camelus dromedarius]KAB1272514.1 Protein DDI1-like protein 1 [Camelus dromedarius]
MLLTVYCVRRDLSEATFSLQVSPDFELHNFRALCELESGIPAEELQVIYMERLLTDSHCSLGSYGLKDGDMVVLLQKEDAGRTASLPQTDFPGTAVPGTSSPRHQHHQHQHQHQHQRAKPAQRARGLGSGGKATSAQGLDSPALIRSMLLSNPHDLSLLKERNPTLAEALLSGNLETFSQVLMEQQRERALREQERLRLYSADPFDLEAQAKIEEEIRQQNIEENMNIAMEAAPESFGQVAMLYISCKVNGHPLKAFVDSGAQMTIMSQACAERCNIMRLVDRRWAGIAKGVGTQRIIGRVHLAQIQIEGDFLQCSFSILEEQPMDMLLGLDMLRTHQCSIDLKKNVLVIGTTGTQTYFLPEGELPPFTKLVSGTGREESSDKEAADTKKHSAMDSGRRKR